MTMSILSQRHVLITGASDGIGWHTATGLARLGAHVTIVGRDPQRGRTAARAIADETRSPHIEFRAADLSSQTAVRKLAADIAARPEGLDILVNNVGGLYTQRWETVDGIEASLAVNALNPFLLTSLLMPTLTRSPQARVVYVTGGMPGRLHLDDLQNTRDYLGIRAYSHAKTAMMALAYEQADRTRDSQVTVNVAYPGGADTPMTRAMTPATMPRALRPLFPLARPMMRRAKPERAARSSIHLASDPALDRVTGTYVNTNSKPTAWPKGVRDDATRRQLWATAHRLTESTPASPRP